MGVFIDRHRVDDIEPAVRHQLRLEAQHGLRDPSGALPLGHWVEDGTIYCVLEAPDEQAVCHHHRERGMGCEEVHLLPGIKGTRPFSGSDQLVVVAAIQRFWHTPVED